LGRRVYPTQPPLISVEELRKILSLNSGTDVQCSDDRVGKSSADAAMAQSCINADINEGMTSITYSDILFEKPISGTEKSLYCPDATVSNILIFCCFSKQKLR
jgi:hypothetical protein